jgi:hypothetical protein
MTIRPRAAGLVRPLLAVAAMLTCLRLVESDDRGEAWQRHTIDDASRGADGVRLADANGDGLLDIATGWEEGGVVRLCLNPGPDHARGKWPAVTVGTVGSVEDAVLVDLDGDGSMDVVSCCEGNVKAVFVHWAPSDRSQYLNSGEWHTRPLLTSDGLMQWMFCVPMGIDGRNGIDLVAGGKGEGAKIGWFESPADPRDLAAWKWHPLCDAGWIMSLIADPDILASDRKGAGRGCLWLENPGAGDEQTKPWPVHRIGAEGREVMFVCQADLDRDGLQDVLAAVKSTEVLYLRRKAADGKSWESFPIRLPEGTGTTKAVNVGDIDLDGKPDLVFTCEQAVQGKSGCMWLSYRNAPTDRDWDAHEISGPEGVKYDLVELLDLDGDGDLDAITCEEAENQGVFWYENGVR